MQTVSLARHGLQPGIGLPIRDRNPNGLHGQQRGSVEASFHLKKKIKDDFVEIVSVEFIAGTPDEIEKVAAISDEGLTRPQVRAFRDSVFPAVKSLEGQTPGQPENDNVHNEVKKAISQK